jgi:hypothetical protein
MSNKKQLKDRDGVISFLKGHEGNAGVKGIKPFDADKPKINMRHESTTSDYGAYYDSKGHLTTGYGSLIALKGQDEGKALDRWREKHGADPFSMKEPIAHTILGKQMDVRTKEAFRAITDLGRFGEEAQKNIIGSWYRGSIKPQHNTVRLINEGNYEEASKNFLNHGEYKGYKRNDPTNGIIARMDNTSAAISKISLDPVESSMSVAETQDAMRYFNQPILPKEDKVTIDTPRTDFVTSDEVPAVEEEVEPVDTAIKEDVTQPVDSSKFDLGLESLDFEMTLDPVVREPSSVEEVDEDEDFLQENSIGANEETQSVEQENIEQEEFKEDNEQFMAQEMSEDTVGAAEKIGGGEVEDLELALLEDDLEQEDKGAQLRSITDEAPSTSLMEDMQSIELDEYLSDLNNTLVARTIVGQIGTNVMTRIAGDAALVDPNFNPFESHKKELEEARSILPNATIEDILEVSVNADMFTTSIEAAKTRIAREKEMQDYTSKHPVLSVTNSLAAMLVEGATFAPVASTIGASTAGIKGLGAFDDILRSASLGSIVRGEAIEQTLQEILWMANDTSYEFDPLMFAGGMALGTGIQKTMAKANIDKALRDIIKNEGGFINLSSEQAKKFVDDVAKHTSDQQALQLAEAVAGRKISVANEVRAKMDAQLKGITRQVGKHTEAMKKFKKGTPEYKKAKGKRQKALRLLEQTEKSVARETEQLLTGTHPELDSKVNVTLGIKEIGEALGIDKEHLKTPDSIRRFLHLDEIDYGVDLVVDGEKSYAWAVRKNLKEMQGNVRLNANEAIKYIANSNGTKKLDELPVIGKLQIGDKLNALANTDGAFSRMLFNTGNLVSSENPLVGAFYNHFAPDGAGRQGTSRMRAIELQQKYSNIYGSRLTRAYQGHGSDLYKVLEGDNIKTVVKGFATPDEFENTVIPIFNERIHIGAEAFAEKYDEAVVAVAERFAKDYNSINFDLNKRAVEVGLENYDFEDTVDYLNRAWDSRKTRMFTKEELGATVKQAMKNKADELGLTITDKELTKQAREFTYGLQNKDITQMDDISDRWIKKMDKLANDVEKGGGDATIIRKEIGKKKQQQLKSKNQELGNRTQLDMEVELPNGMKLRDLLEDNFVHTQRRIIEKTSAKIALAETGIKDMSVVDDWINDAYEAEVKRFAKQGSKNPKADAEFVKEAMKRDFMSFKNGGMNGLGDVPDEGVNTALRLAKKYNYASLMQYAAISSIAEFGGTIVEAGVSSTFDAIKGSLRQHITDIYYNNPSKFTSTLYDELSGIMGVGMEDLAFSSKGFSKASRILDESSSLYKVEQGLDTIGRFTQGTFGGIETVGRRITAESLAIKWANLFTGKEKGGLLGAFFGSNGASNRVLENAGLGTFVNGEFKPNKLYKSIEKNMKKHAKFNSDGNLKNLNLKDWDTDAKYGFGDVIQLQASHIAVNPDTTTRALWHSSLLGQLLMQFQTFTINATTKVAGQAFFNAAISSNRGDQAEMIKAAQKIFWGTSLGILAVTLRQGIDRAGGDNGVDIFDEGAIKAAAIGFSRSSMAGNLPTLVDTIGGRFGNDPIFEKTSSIGRSKNMFNLATTPVGQAVSRGVKGGEKLLQGDVGGSAMQLYKTSPFYRQLGLKQLFNYADKEK